MKKIVQRKKLYKLIKKRIKNFDGVLYSAMKYFMDEGLKRGKIMMRVKQESISSHQILKLKL